MVENNKLRFLPLDKEIHGTHLIDTPAKVAPYNWHEVPYHRHNGYEMYLFLNGNVRFYIEDHCYELKRGDLVLLNAKEMHRAFCVDKLDYERISIYISESYINKLSTTNTDLSFCFNMRNIGENNVIRLSVDSCNEFIRLTDCLIKAENDKKFGNDVLIRSYAEQLLILANNAYIEFNLDSGRIINNVMPDIIKKVMNYIEENLQEKISLEDISKKCLFSGTYISRQFKEHTGLTLRSYIVERRIARAEELLRSGKSVKEAAYQSGFKDYSNFIRTFRKVVGIPPGQYKKKYSKIV